MDFFAVFFGVLPFGLGFAGAGLGLATGLGLKGCLAGFLRLTMRFLLVEGPSIFYIPKVSQKLPISLRV